MSETTGDEIKVSITASVKGLVDGLKSATDSVKKSTEEMGGLFEKLAKTVDNLKAPFMALTGLAAGGALFKEILGKTVEWNGEVGKLAKTLGTSAERASVWAVALEGANVQSDAVSTATAMLTRQVASGGKAFEQLGIHTRNADGSLKSAGTLMQDSLSVIREYREGIDRNAAGTALFGKAWGEVAPLLKITEEKMAEAEERARKLHLVVGPEGVAMAKKYKEAQRDLKEVFTSISVQVGEQLLPYMVQLGSWLAGAGAESAHLFSYALKGVAQAFMAIKAVIDTVSTYVAATIQAWIDGFMMLTRVLVKVLGGDYKGAIAEARAGWNAMKTDFIVGTEQVVDAWKGFASSSKDLWKRQPMTLEPIDLREPEGKTFQSAPPDTRLADWKKQLEGLKLEEGNWFTWSKEREQEFWESKLSLTRAGEETRKEVELEVLRQRKGSAEADHAERIGELRTQLEEERNDGKKRLAVLREILAEQTALYGDASRQALEAQRKLQHELSAQAKTSVTEMIGLARTMGESFGSAFTGMVTGAKSFTAAIAEMAKTAIKLVIEMVVKSVTAKAADAAAGAAASQSAIPIVGPILAVAAMGTMLAAVTGLLSGLPSAAGGYDIPRSVNPVTRLHGGEMVLPARYADVIRGMADGRAPGGAGEAHYHFHGTLIDSGSVRRLIESDAWQRATREVARNGRGGG